MVAAFVLLPVGARAETVAVLGDGGEIARAIAAPDREVMGPSAARTLLAAKRRGAAADPSAARALAAAGREAYAGAFFDEAVDQLSRAAATYLATGLRDVPADEIASLHLDLGLAHLAAGDRELAEREVALALRIQPAIVPAASHGPPVRRFVEAVRAALPRAAVLKRTIRTEPAGAAVVLDGQDRSSADALDVAIGSHLAVVRAPGRATVAYRVEVNERSPEPIALALPEEDPAQVALDALDGGELETAATLGREVLDVDAAVAVRGTHAVLARRGAAARSADGNTREIARALFPSRAAGTDRDPAARALSSREDPQDDEGSGMTWWLVAGGATVVAAGVVAAVLLLQPESDDRTLQPHIRDP